MDEPLNETKIRAYMFAATWMSLTKARDEAMEALKLLEETVKPRGKELPFQLLAVRRYLRIGDRRLHANWSWTEGDVARQYALEPTRTLYAEATKVQTNFSKANPGFRLELTPIRSLERQARLWMDNTTVQLASARLMKDMDKELRNAAYPDTCGGPAALKFAGKLRAAIVEPEPTSAAPGSSDHGRGTAVDFIIMRGATRIAGTAKSEIGPVWDSKGWSAKLKAAVAGTRLKGPLKHPYEPWHWSL